MSPAAALPHARPETVEQAVARLLARPAPRERSPAGGRSPSPELVPALAARLAPAPALLVDLAALPGLDAIEALPGGGLRIGALVRQRAAERSALVARRAPLLAAALALVGHPSTRNRGTVLGSLAHAEAGGRGAGGRRRARRGCRDRRPGRRAAAAAGALRCSPVPVVLTLAPGELLLAVRLAGAAPGERQAWVEFAPRRLRPAARRRGAARGSRCRGGRGRALTLAGVGPGPVNAAARAGEIAGDDGSRRRGRAARRDARSPLDADRALRRRCGGTSRARWRCARCGGGRDRWLSRAAELDDRADRRRRAAAGRDRGPRDAGGGAARPPRRARRADRLRRGPLRRLHGRRRRRDGARLHAAGGAARPRRRAHGREPRRAGGARPIRCTRRSSPSTGCSAASARRAC